MRAVTWLKPARRKRSSFRNAWNCTQIHVINSDCEKIKWTSCCFLNIWSIRQEEIKCREHMWLKGRWSGSKTADASSHVRPERGNTPRPFIKSQKHFCWMFISHYATTTVSVNRAHVTLTQCAWVSSCLKWHWRVTILGNIPPLKNNKDKIN